MPQRRPKPIVVLLISVGGLLLAACESNRVSGLEKNGEFRGIAVAPAASSVAADPLPPLAPKIAKGPTDASSRAGSDGGVCGCAPTDPLCSCL